MYLGPVQGIVEGWLHGISIAEGGRERGVRVDAKAPRDDMEKPLR